MKKTLTAAFLAALTFTAACTRLNTPEKKAGYAIGASIGRSLASIKDKIELAQVYKGIKDQVAGKTDIDTPEMQKLIDGLRQGQAGDKGKTGYAVGMSIGNNVKPTVGLADLNMIPKGIADGLEGKSKLDDATMNQVLQDLGQRQRAEGSVKNKAEGEAYQAKNKARTGVKVTASGLQYEVLRPGKGPSPKTTSTVKVNYLGTLIAGTKFDSSYDRGQPATFPLNGVIPGWTEGLQLMNVGSKYRFVIPSAIAYGPNGMGNTIGPDATLVFEVELLAITKK